MENWNDIRGQLAALAPDKAEDIAKFEKPEDFVSHTFRPDPDWRRQAAGDNEDDYKHLQSFDGPGSLYKSLRDTQAALRDNGRIKVPGENATPEERAAWNRARGVPDKPEDYKVKVAPPEGYEVTDDDRNFLSATTKALHEAGAEPHIVDLAHKLYFDAAAKSAGATQEQLDLAAVAADTQLEKLWGPGKAENVAFANAAVAQFFPGEANENGHKPIVDLNIQAPDGFVGCLGDWPPFVQMMAMVGRQHAEDPYFLQAAGATNVPDPEARKREILALRSTNPKEYERLASEGGELDKLNAAIERRKQRTGVSR